jgi:hypothetical protein
MFSKFKLAALSALVAVAAVGCGVNTVKVATHKEYVVPEWHAECVTRDTESNGLAFWDTEEIYFACGEAQSGFPEAAKIKATNIAKRHMADVVNGRISAGEKIRMSDIGTPDDMRSETETEMLIVNKIEEVALTDYSVVNHYTYRMKGQFFSFARIALPKNKVEEAIAEAKKRDRLKSAPAVASKLNPGLN